MRILIATHDQADFPGTEPYGYIRALTDLGHETQVFHYRKKSFFYSNFRRAWIRDMNRRLIRKVRDWKADVLLVIRGGYVRADTVLAINRSTSCVTVNWFPDSPFGLASYPPLPYEAIRAYRLFLTKDRYFERELRAFGVDQARYLPHGYDAGFYHPPDLTEEDRRRFGPDVSFVGAAYPFRIAMLDGLVGPEVNLRIWGPPAWRRVESEWVRDHYAGGPIGDEKVLAFAATGINLNLPHPGGAVLALDERPFCIAGCGGFQVVHDKNGTQDFFEPGREIVTFRDREDLRRIIKHYLARPEERAEIARRGLERARRDHTHHRRAQTLLDRLADLQ